MPQSGFLKSHLNLTLAEVPAVREHLEKQVIGAGAARAPRRPASSSSTAPSRCREKAMAEEDRIGFFLSDNLMHHMILASHVAAPCGRGSKRPMPTWSASAGCAPPRRFSTIRTS